MVERSLSMREVPGSIPGFSRQSFFHLLQFLSAINREVPGYDFPCQNPYGLHGFFRGVLHTIFGTENPCELAFIRTMFRMEILRHRVQKDFSRTNLVRETSIFGEKI